MSARYQIDLHPGSKLTWRGIPEPIAPGSDETVTIWHSAGGQGQYSIRPRECFGRPYEPIQRLYSGDVLLGEFLHLKGAKLKVKKLEAALSESAGPRSVSVFGLFVEVLDQGGEWA